LLLAVEVQSRSEQRLLMPFFTSLMPSHFIYSFCFVFFFVFFFVSLFVFCTIIYFVVMFCFFFSSKGGRGALGGVEHYIIFSVIFHLRREGEHLEGGIQSHVLLFCYSDSFFLTFIYFLNFFLILIFFLFFIFSTF